MTTDTLRRYDAAAPAFSAPGDVDRLQRLGLVAGGVGALLCLLGLFLSPAYFFRGWLVGFVFWTGLTAGCLALLMLSHLSGGSWGVVIRRVMEAASRTWPVMLLLSVPLFFGMQELYEWARPEIVRGDELLQHKSPYLNVPFFWIRMVFYFAVWGGLSWTLSRMSLRQDRGDDPGITRRMQVVAAPGLIAYCLLVTFAAVDWLMSLQPHWFSTIYGVYLIGSQGLASLAFLILIALFLYRREPMSRVLQPRHFHDWGKLMFAFVMLWAYFSWSQFLITWSGNLPEEIPFYLKRMQGGWGWLSIGIALFHFAVPFAVLLSRDIKRKPGILAWVAAFILIMRVVELFWQVEPAFQHGLPGAVEGQPGVTHDISPAAAASHAEEAIHPQFWWLYLAGPLAIGGAWLFWFARELKSRPLLPVQEPYLPEAIAHESHH
jgi:hypothetical protein